MTTTTTPPTATTQPPYWAIAGLATQAEWFIRNRRVAGAFVQAEWLSYAKRVAGAFAQAEWVHPNKRAASLMAQAEWVLPTKRVASIGVMVEHSMPQVPGDNLLENPGAEDGLNGWGEGGGGPFEVWDHLGGESHYFVSGASPCEVGATKTITQEIDLIAGGIDPGYLDAGPLVEVGAWQAGNGIDTGQIVVDFLDGPGGSPSGPPFVGPEAAPTGWIEVRHSQVLPSGTRAIRFSFTGMFMGTPTTVPPTTAPQLGSTAPPATTTAPVTAPPTTGPPASTLPLGTTGPPCIIHSYFDDAFVIIAAPVPTTVPPTTAPPLPVPHPCDIAADFSIGEADLMPYIDSYIAGTDAVQYGIPAGSRAEHIVQAILIYLAGQTYLDAHTAVLPGDPDYPLRWQPA